MRCVTCGTVISTAAIPKLPDNDNSDEDGNSKVGDYSILITDKDGKPVFDSEISIDRNDNITIKLPDGRLLSAEDITTITVTDSRTQQPATDINIFIAIMLITRQQVKRTQMVSLPFRIQIRQQATQTAQSQIMTRPML